MSMRPHPSTRNRSGFTLIELLVVIAIVAVLVALLLPAVQTAREAARRVQCTNNLKQIGLGFQNYHSLNDVFPIGGFGGSLPTEAVGDSQGVQARRINSWGTAILPFVEQAPLYNSINQSRWYINAENSTAAGTIISTYICPTNATMSLTRPNGENPKGPSLYGRNDYSGNYGERAVRCFPATTCQNTYDDLGDTSKIARGMTLTVSTAPISIKHITDGTTYTIVAGEAHEAAFGSWMGHKNFLDQSAPINARNGTVPGTIWASCQVAKGNTTIGRLGCDFSQEFASYHSGGAAFAFADGSARFLKESINNKVLGALLSRKGQEIVSADSL
ncbi:prepilin-type N-terminal cleavage/methylation domain-containing protein/prepilin-type processing-associated H-X9-DG domain-containing protein [Singulisphaera sp. GP187]|uniref:DUF1559 domain-containing protein n=1 Tax=Singulisphaera sp. GP187 TaxID=1882752 RepID=UPI000925BCF9|nr:DUF1559 domain-containing protein [Singulisphaera sp. GP187]SIO59721.1 prepilin-type N-terminal cleavage/methylation domain-containing protein/prepilin-type processing-associated H-X9-DG domain-containing protein [Singulisphaera sp. GP187]